MMVVDIECMRLSPCRLIAEEPFEWFWVSLECISEWTDSFTVCTENDSLSWMLIDDLVELLAVCYYLICIELEELLICSMCT